MGLGDLFHANSARVLSLFGVGVTANSVVYKPPGGGSIPITEFVFENTSASPLSITQSGTDDDELAEIEISREISVQPKGVFVIDDRVWKFRGRGGTDLNTQTILLRGPKPLDQAQTKGRV